MSLRSNKGEAYHVDCKGNPNGAVSELEAALQEPSPQAVVHDEAVANRDRVAGGLEHAVMLNNLAVGLLYAGDLKGATRHLEEMVVESSQPHVFLAAIRNLITLHEFSPQKLRKVATLRRKLHEIGTEENELLSLFPNESR